MAPPPLRNLLKVRATGGVMVVTVTDSALAGDRIGPMTEEVRRLAGGQDVHLDFGSVTALGGRELGHLVTLHKVLMAAGGRLTITNVEAKLFEVFALTGLAKVLDVRPQVPG
jgi:anti-anti-sigma regulatory factor